MKQQQHLYDRLQAVGFIIVSSVGKIKANVDVDLTLYVMKLLPEYDRALLITNDGDFAVLVRYLKDVGKFLSVLVPKKKYCSKLLKKEA